MARPKKLYETSAMAQNTDNKEYFKTKYSLKAQAGGADGLIVGQEIYCLPLVKDGVYEFSCHGVKPKGKKGFKNNKFTAYIPCHGTNDETGEYDPNCTCCQIAQKQWDEYVANGKKGETLITFRTSKVYIPILLLGNESGSKTATNVPVTKLTMTGRAYSYLDLGQKTFKEIITSFKENLVNTGRIEYDLEGEALQAAVMREFQRHILKISINKPDGFGKHKKVFSFIPFDNKAIGAETGSYMNITEGLNKSAKLIAEAKEFCDKFSIEVDSFLVPWEDEELINYFSDEEETTASATPAQATAKPAQTTPPKSEQIVIEETAPQDDDLEFDDDLGLDDNEEIDIPALDTTPSVAPQAEATVDVDDDDLSFDMGEEDFFGEE